MAIGDTARLIASLELQDKFSSKARTITGSVNSLESGFSQMQRGAGNVAHGLTTLGTRAAIAAAGGLTAVVTTAASFEQAFTGIEKTVDAGGRSVEENTKIFAALEEQFRQMARTIPVSFEELAGIGAEGGALGIAKEDLLDFTDVVARLAVSTNLTADSAATALGQLGNVLHLSGGDFRDFADSLVALGNAGASTEDQIVQVAARFAAAGNAAGLSKEDILALGSAVASMGIQVEAGGSALSRIFNAVATNIGTSSEKAVVFAETLGLSAKEFRRAWEEDALGTFQEFLTELNKLDQFKQASVLKGIGITNVRDVNTVRLMAQNIGLVSDQLKIAHDAQGALNTESDKFFQTTSGQWQVLVNNLRDAGATIGNELLPVVKDLIKEFTGFLNNPQNQEALKNFGKDLAQRARDLIKAFKSGEFDALIDDLKSAAGFARAAFEAFNALPGPVKQFAIAALVANKVTGGALGQITSGLSDIFSGAIKLALGNTFLAKGGTPVNPLWVSVVGGLGGGPGGPGGVPVGGRGLLSTALKATIVGAVAVAAAEGLRQIALQLDPGSDARKAEFQREGGGFLGLEKVLRDLFGPDRTPGAATPIGQFDPRNLGGTPMPVDVKNTEDITGGFEGSMRNAIDTSKLTLEQRLIRDSLFKQSLDTKEFISILKRTSEFGAKGVGTTIEQGRTTGRDPVGDAFVALTKRLEKPALKSVVVQGEISRHITALEQVQSRLLKEGQVEEARHAQRNIDTLYKLIGSVDRTRPDLQRIKDAQDRVAEQVAEQRSIQAHGNTILGQIAGKDFSPDVDVTVNTSTTISVSDVIRSVTHTSYVSRQTQNGMPGASSP